MASFVRPTWRRFARRRALQLKQALPWLAILLALSLNDCVPVGPVPTGGGARATAAAGSAAQIPPFARRPFEPFSRDAAIQIALGEWRAFRSPVVYPFTQLPGDEEREEGLWQRVGLYWWIGLDSSWPQQGWTGIHDENGVVFPAADDGNYAWSAAFISYVMRLAGAGSHFPYSETHSDYIDAAARHDPGVALLAQPVASYAPRPGDLICAWRGRQPVTFAQLPAAGRFPSHCDIIVAAKLAELDVIGGNVDNAVAMKPVPITADGHLAGPDGIVIDPEHHWFVVLEVEYQRGGIYQSVQASAAPSATALASIGRGQR